MSLLADRGSEANTDMVFVGQRGLARKDNEEEKCHSLGYCTKDFQ